MFAIRRKTDGLYSNGSTWFSYVRFDQLNNGYTRIWPDVRSLRQHVARTDRNAKRSAQNESNPYDDCEIAEVSLTELSSLDLRAPKKK